MNKIVPIFFLLITASCHTPVEQKGLEITNKKAIDSTVNLFVDGEHYPFLYTRLEDKDGEVLYEHTAKNNRLLGDQKIDGDTWIRVWSMSKIVTICIALDLMEDGLLNVDDPVTKYIPEFSQLQVALTADSNSLIGTNWYEEDSSQTAPCPLTYVPNDSVMTIRHLLDHKAGFYYSTASRISWPNNIHCLDSMMTSQDICSSMNGEDLINKLSSFPLMQNPGTGYFYGLNTTVLGLVAERASGRSLAQLLKERVTDPMQIKGMRYDLPEGETMLPRFCGKDSLLREAKAGELNIFGHNIPDYEPAHELYLGGEGMICTADGYCDFLRMLLNNGELNGYRMLNPETIADLTSPHTQLDNPYGHNGYNLWVSSDSMRLKGQGDQNLWIGGGYEGTHFWIDTSRNFVGTIMTQLYWVYDGAFGYTKDGRIRGEIYKPWTGYAYKN